MTPRPAPTARAAWGILSEAGRRHRRILDSGDWREVLTVRIPELQLRMRALGAKGVPFHDDYAVSIAGLLIAAATVIDAEGLDRKGRHRAKALELLDAYEAVIDDAERGGRPRLALVRP